MIRQDDERIVSSEIRENGSAFFSILYYVNKFTNKRLSPAKIEIFYTQLKEASCFKEDTEWDTIFNFFNMNVKSVIKGDPKYKAKKGEFLIAKYIRDEKVQYAPTFNGVCLYDSLGVSTTITEGEIESYVVFKMVKGK